MQSHGDLDFTTLEMVARSRTSVAFQVKACAAVHIKLSEIPRITETNSYEVRRRSVTAKSFLGKEASLCLRRSTRKHSDNNV